MRLIFSFVFIFSFLINSLAQDVVRFQTDRPVYFPGDTIWYKTYFTHHDRLDTSLRNMSLSIGQVQGNILEDQLRPVFKGISYGQFVIPRDFKDHELYFNLFTKRNIIQGEIKDPMAFKIGVFQKKQIVSKVIPQVKYSIEGGGIMKNSINRIKLAWNVKEKIKASFRDEEGNIIKSFITDGLNESQIEIPVKSSIIYLDWEYAGKNYSETLPVSKSLVRLRLKDHKDSTYLYVDNQIGPKVLRLEFTRGNYKLLDTLLQFVNKGTDSLEITELFRGRFYGDFTIFDKGYPYAYLKVNQLAEIHPMLETKTVSFENFQFNEFHISIPGERFWNSSITVYDGDLPPPQELTHVLSPYISFISGNYRYSYVIDDMKSASQERLVDSTFTLQGSIHMKENQWDKFLETKKKKSSKLKSKNKELRLLSFGYRLLENPNYIYQEVDFDSLRNINLPKLTFYDTLEVRFVQIDERLKLIDYDVNLAFSTLPKLKELHISNYLIGQDISQEYLGRYHPDYYQFEFGNTELKEVQISRKQDTRKNMLRKKYSTDWFLQHDSFLDIDLLNYDLPSWVFTLDELKNLLYHRYPKLRGLQADILVNNLHNYQGGILPSDVTEIAYIRVYEQYVHNKLGGGAIMLYTTGIDARKKDIGTAKIRIKKVSGYSPFLDFNIPDYSRNSKPKYDDRLTLHWLPDQSIKGGELTNFKFFNNSLSKSYYIHLNLISEGGTFISQWKKVTP